MKKLVLLSSLVFTHVLPANNAQFTPEILDTKSLFSSIDRYKTNFEKTQTKDSELYRTLKYQELAATMQTPRFKVMCSDEAMYRDRTYLYMRNKYIIGKLLIDTGGTLLWISSLLLFNAYTYEKFTRECRQYDVIPTENFNFRLQVTKLLPNIFFPNYPKNGKVLFSLNEYVKITDKDIIEALNVGIARGVMQAAFYDKKIIPSHVIKEVSYGTAMHLFCNKTGCLMSNLNERYNILDPKGYPYSIAAAIGNVALPFIGTQLIDRVLPRAPFIFEVTFNNKEGPSKGKVAFETNGKLAYGQIPCRQN